MSADDARRGHSRQSSTSSAYVAVNTGRRGSAKDPEALQAAIDRARNRKRRTNSTASRTDDDDDEGGVQRQRQEDARLIRCDAEQQRRNELGKGYDRLRAALNRGDERLSKARVVERATARVVQLRDQNTRMEEELGRKQGLIRDLNRANEQLMLEASGALVSSPSSASSHSAVPPRSSSLPTPPHTIAGHSVDGEFGLAPALYSKDAFAYTFDGSFEPATDFYPLDAVHPRPDSPRSYDHAFDPNWLNSPDRPQWSNAALAGSFNSQFTSPPSREPPADLSEVPASAYPPW